MSTLVYYYIPEDNETHDKLNAFIIYKNLDGIKLDDIKENFPLPGEYIFRFKFKIQNSDIWIDLSTDVIPKYEGKIIMKVARLSWTSKDLNNDQKSNYPDLI